ncbi:MAG: DUF3298 domain-containing protein [Porphyromonadaceae bacterium]|nr:DUF3298 domain-containing protein [Porphyromonadaceae bacterium]
MKQLYTLTSLCLLFVCLMGSTLSSCTGRSGSAQSADSTLAEGTQDPNGPLDWDSIVVSTTYFDNQVARKGSSVEVELFFRYPKNDSALLKAVSGVFFGEAYANWSPKEATERYLREVRSEYLFGADSLGFSAKELEDMKSEMTISNYITYHDDHIITMQKDVYNYSAGAAHGLPGTGNYTFDRKSKDVISEGDLFIDGYGPELNKILQRALIKEFGRKSAQEMESKDGIYAADLTSNDNFRLDDKGMTYTYNPYEIAPFAIGIIEIFIPYEEVRQLLRPQSIIFNYIQP